MRLSILTVLPMLLGAANADYHLNCDDGKGHKKEEKAPMKPGETTECKPFDHGYNNFEYWQDDGKGYSFEFYEDKKCKGKKTEKKAEKKKDDKEKAKAPAPVWGYKAKCY